MYVVFMLIVNQYFLAIFKSQCIYNLQILIKTFFSKPKNEQNEKNLVFVEKKYEYLTVFF